MERRGGAACPQAASVDRHPTGRGCGRVSALGTMRSTGASPSHPDEWPDHKNAPAVSGQGGAEGGAACPQAASVRRHPTGRGCGRVSALGTMRSTGASPSRHGERPGQKNAPSVSGRGGAEGGAACPQAASVRRLATGRGCGRVSALGTMRSTGASPSRHGDRPDQKNAPAVAGRSGARVERLVPKPLRFATTRWGAAVAASAHWGQCAPPVRLPRTLAKGRTTKTPRPFQAGAGPRVERLVLKPLRLAGPRFTDTPRR